MNDTRGSPAGWLDLAGLFWLLFIASACLVLATFQPTIANNTAPSPFDGLDAPSLALLACVVLAGIMRYGFARRRAPAATRGAAPGPPPPDDRDAGVEP